jgi:hypothetical protein
VADWYRRHAEVARRWRDLHHETCARIERRVQAAAAAPSVAGHPAPPASFSARWQSWSAAVEVERKRLFEGAQPSNGQTPPPPKRHDHPGSSLGVRPDVANILGRIDDAETAAERRRERQRPRAGQPTFMPGYHYSAGLDEEQRIAEQEHLARGPTVSM